MAQANASSQHFQPVFIYPPHLAAVLLMVLLVPVSSPVMKAA